MFIYGRSDTGLRQYCYCEIEATQNGTCTEKFDYYFDLFKYDDGKSFDMI